MRNRLFQFLKADAGSIVVEYAIMIALLSIVILGLIVQVGANVACSLGKVKVIAFGGILQCD